jgi:putative multiple sugar transport system permease protein
MTSTLPKKDPSSDERPGAGAAALHSGTSNLRRLLAGNVRQSGIVIAFVAIVALFAVLTGGVSLSPGNITNIVLQYSYILVLAIGMVIVIVGGHIDLSVGSVVALTGAVAAVLVIGGGLPWWVGVVAAVGVGVLVGVWHGFWVAYVGIPAFIVTLAGMLLFRGLTLQVLGNISLSPFPAGYQQIAGGFLNGLIGGQGYDAFTVLIGALGVAGYAVLAYRSRVAKVLDLQQVESSPLFGCRIALVGLVVMAFAWQLASSRGLPVVLVVLSVLVLAYGLLTRRTVFGRHVYALGGNAAAARLSGVKVKAVTFWIFVNMGFLAGWPVSSTPHAPTAPSPRPGTCSSSTRSPPRSSAVPR